MCTSFTVKNLSSVVLKKVSKVTVNANRLVRPEIKLFFFFYHYCSKDYISVKGILLKVFSIISVIPNLSPVIPHFRKKKKEVNSNSPKTILFNSLVSKEC